MYSFSSSAERSVAFSPMLDLSLAHSLTLTHTHTDTQHTHTHTPHADTVQASCASKEYIHSCRIRVSLAPESFYYNSWKADSPWLHLHHSRADTWKQWGSWARLCWRGWREDIGRHTPGDCSIAQDRHQTYWKHNGSQGSRSFVSATSLTTISTTSLTTISAHAKGYEYSNSSSTGKMKEKSIIPPSGLTLKEEAEHGRKKINLREDSWGAGRENCSIYKSTVEA